MSEPSAVERRKPTYTAAPAGIFGAAVALVVVGVLALGASVLYGRVQAEQTERQTERLLAELLDIARTNRANGEQIKSLLDQFKPCIVDEVPPAPACARDKANQERLASALAAVAAEQVRQHNQVLSAIRSRQRVSTSAVTSASTSTTSTTATTTAAARPTVTPEPLPVLAPSSTSTTRPATTTTTCPRLPNGKCRP